MDAAAASRAVIIVRRARVPADRWEEAPRRAPFPARSNARAKTSLGVELLFPTYREGLAAIAGGDKTPFD